MGSYHDLITALREMDLSESCPCSHPEMCDGKDCIVWQAADVIERLDNTIIIPDERATTVAVYPVRELVFFSQMCRRHNISEDQLHDFCTGALNGYYCGIDDFRRVQENMLKTLSDRFNIEPRKGGPVDDGPRID